MVTAASLSANRFEVLRDVLPESKMWPISHAAGKVILANINDCVTRCRNAVEHRGNLWPDFRKLGPPLLLRDGDSETPEAVGEPFVKAA